MNTFLLVKSLHNQFRLIPLGAVILLLQLINPFDMQDFLIFRAAYPNLMFDSS